MSKQSIPLLVHTKKASGAVAARRFVTATGAQAGAAANTLGVSQWAAQDGEDFPVTGLGTEVVEVGAAIAEGAAVETDAQGRAVTKAAGPTLARALQASSAAGEFIEVSLIPN